MWIPDRLVGLSSVGMMRGKTWPLSITNEPQSEVNVDRKQVFSDSRGHMGKEFCADGSLPLVEDEHASRCSSSGFSNHT